MQQALADLQGKQQLREDLVDKQRQLSLDDVNGDEVDDDKPEDPVGILQQIRMDHPIESSSQLRALVSTNPRAAKLWISSYFCESASSEKGIMVALGHKTNFQEKLRHSVYPICRSLSGWPSDFKWPTYNNGKFHKSKVRPSRICPSIC